MADNFRDGLEEYEKENFDNLVKQGCKESSVEKFLRTYQIDFDGARQVLSSENPGIDLICFETEEGEVGVENKEVGEGINLDDEYPEMTKEMKKTGYSAVDGKVDLDKEFPSMQDLPPDEEE